MAQWQCKDLSKITGVSVQTLHHYDRIGVLKPSIRLSNGYRVYSEADLLILQQIIALKFLGLKLSVIKQLLLNQNSALEIFTKQVKFLQDKAYGLLAASEALQRILSVGLDDKSICFETIIETIEVYKMAQELENSWVSKVLTADELKQYAKVSAFGVSKEHAVFEQKWQAIIAEVKSNLKYDARSKLGIEFGKKFMTLINDTYGMEHAHLRTKILEQGFGEGIGLNETGLNPDVFVWLSNAVDAYFRERIAFVLSQVGKLSETKLLTLWHEVMNEMYGNETGRKLKALQQALQEPEISPEAKNWLKKIAQS